MKVSIVINTYNRGFILENTLKSLYYLKYSDVEVIVVNGPSTDNTNEILKKYSNDIKIGYCPLTNLSVSRNIGICMSSGDIVAFIDDDAIPEPEWLNDLVAGYDCDEVGGVGGLVYNHTGYDFQTKYILCDRFGGNRTVEKNPTQYYNFPFAREFSSLMGTNASFRKDILLKIGGFDEEFAYFLDETDVCMRIVDAGYVIRFMDNAFVHHKFAPSHLRDHKRIIKDWYQIVRSTSYYAFRNAETDTVSISEVMNKITNTINNIRGGIDSGYINGIFTNIDEYENAVSRIEKGVKAGISDCLLNKRELITDEKLTQYDSPFKLFHTKRRNGRVLKICFLSQGYPPENTNGIARFISELAQGIAKIGHDVHVITTGRGHNTVDFENGVWVHRIIPKHQSQPISFTQDYGVIPQTLWDYSQTMYEEVLRIHSHYPVDIVQAPIWDIEGIAFLLNKKSTSIQENHATSFNATFKFITSLHTTYKLSIDSHKEWLTMPQYMENHINRIIGAEQILFEKSDYILANSNEIVQSVEQAYAMKFKQDRLFLVHHGLSDKSQIYHRQRDDDFIDILYVGRLENRKGIDVLLDCIPALCDKYANIRFVIVGDDSIKNENGSTYKDDFLRRYHGSLFLQRVIFAGKVTDSELYQHYADCDIFVAPSRYESFGLIFLEAMMFGKPVIGCKVGGMLEVIRENINGFLAEPGDKETLYNALHELIANREKRISFGKKSRELYQKEFTTEKMAENIVNMYGKIRNYN